ncbi:MAG: tyrosine--tRNA ligase [Anaerolineales bacterium]|nr:tyrosine--tRNA ligase [Anaerolineales bacterium]MCA9930840.1 tyrosine--tRNA ligase [Anaerolineales bacterium]
MVYDHTEAVPDLLTNEKITVYNGFDPTADSLHIGNLVPMMGLARLQRFGHTPIALAGGGTGMIGDPSGKSSERNLLDTETIEYNVSKIKVELSSVLDFEVKSNPAQVVNNADWLAPVSMMHFLRDVGKHFTVNYMLGKDSVKSRVDREGSGISYTEFSYMLLQAYDFLHLFQTHNCVMQAGGSDQWGNITAGVELIRRSLGQRAHGLVYPLVTKADGTKFGKTESGTVWLSPKRTSPYRFYQFWLNADDADAINYLKYFTWLSQAEIKELEDALFERPEQREAQRKLAQEVTRMIHGKTAVAKAEKAAQVLFGGDLDGLDAGDIRDIFADVPSSDVPKTELGGDGLPVVDLLVSSGLASSKGDARRSIKGGGIYLNNERVTDGGQMVMTANAIEGQFLVLRKGRKKYHLVQIRS